MVVPSLGTRGTCQQSHWALVHFNVGRRFSQQAGWGNGETLGFLHWQIDGKKTVIHALKHMKLCWSLQQTWSNWTYLRYHWCTMMYIDVVSFLSFCWSWFCPFEPLVKHEISHLYTDRGACSAGRVNPLKRVLLLRVRPVALTNNAGTISAALTAMVVPSNLNNGMVSRFFVQISENIDGFNNNAQREQLMIFDSKILWSGNTGGCALGGGKLTGFSCNTWEGGKLSYIIIQWTYARTAKWNYNTVSNVPLIICVIHYCHINIIYVFIIVSSERLFLTVCLLQGM